MEDNNSGESATFNAAIHHVNRIGLSQLKINNANINPLAFNPQEGVYNYEIILEENLNLYREVVPKLKPKEIAIANRMMEEIEKFISGHPIHIMSEGKSKLLKERWKIFKPLLNSFQKLIKVLLDIHDVNNPSKKDLGGL